jgi:hypothetical protein
MSNEHHQTGRRPDKASEARLNPEHRDKQPLNQASEAEHHNDPNSKPPREHQHRSFVDAVKALDSAKD